MGLAGLCAKCRLIGLLIWVFDLHRYQSEVCRLDSHSLFLTNPQSFMDIQVYHTSALPPSSSNDTLSSLCLATKYASFDSYCHGQIICGLEEENGPKGESGIHYAMLPV